MAATESIVSANNKPASPYRGSGYRSIAFGTWAVGDASRRFQQPQQSRRRGQSSSVAPGKRGGIGEEAATENSQRGIKMASGSKQSATQQPQQSTADQPGNRQSAAAGTSPAHPLCHSLIDIRRHATNDQQQPTALTTQSMNHRLLVAEQPQQEDFYSSSEYVRHSAVGSGPAEHNYENAASLLASMPALACCNHRSLETLHLASVPLSAHHQPSCSSPASSRISCPPYSQPSSQPHQHQSKQQQQLRFGGLVIDPLRSGGGRRKATKQRPTTAEGPPATGMRNRTKSLDNGLKFSLASRHRRVGEGGGDHSLAVDLGNISTTSNRPPAPTVANDAEAQQQHSRLDQAKQFLRRFYASSTMRLARRKWKEATAEQQQQQQQQSSADGALMFSSAMGPFFELRRPCEEELPLLPYNIHYAVESVDDGDEEEDDQEEEEAEADSSSVSVEWTECSAHHPQQPVTHHFHHHHQLQQQQQYSMGAASTPIGRRHPPAPSTSRRAISFQDQQQQSAAANQSMLANGSPTLTPGSSASASGLVAASQQQSAWISSTTSSSSSSSSGGRELTLLAGASTSLILDSSSNNQQPGCTFTFACSSASMPTSSNSPDSAIGTSPSAEDSPSAPSACCGSLSSSDSSAETTKRNRPTTAKEQSAAGNQHNQQRQQPTAAAHRGGGEAGPAERRFANWNELFQYLRREIMEMNVRDAQILRNLETIQAEMNGMRQLQQQQKRKPRLDWNNKTHHQQHHLGSRQQMSKSYSHPN